MFRLGDIIVFYVSRICSRFISSSRSEISFKVHASTRDNENENSEQNVLNYSSPPTSNTVRIKGITSTLFALLVIND